MEKFEVIEYNRTRDFSNKMNATFGFIRQNFLPLSKSILLIAGPPVLVVSLIFGSFINDLLSLGTPGLGGSIMRNEYITSPAFWAQLVLIGIFFVVSGVMSLAAINGYLVLYGEKRSNRIEVKEVWDRVRSTFWMYFGTGAVITLLFVVCYAAILGLLALSAMASTWIAVLLGLVLVPAFFYVFIAASLSFIVRTYEPVNSIEAVIRSVKLVAGKWWSTFGLIMVLYMIMGTLSYIPMIPLYITLIVSAMHSLEAQSYTPPSEGMQWLTTVSMAFYYLVYLLLGAIPAIGLAFQYFNLVERKEAKGLMSQLQNFGQPQGPAVEPHEEQY